MSIYISIFYKRNELRQLLLTSNRECSNIKSECFSNVYNVNLLDFRVMYVVYPAYILQIEEFFVIRGALWEH